MSTLLWEWLVIEQIEIQQIEGSAWASDDQEKRIECEKMSETLRSNTEHK